jgi:hypothetical protein
MDFLAHIDRGFVVAQLPNVTASLHNVSALLEGDIEQEVTKGQQEFEKVREHIQQIVDEGKPLISDAIKRAGQIQGSLDNSYLKGSKGFK